MTDKAPETMQPFGPSPLNSFERIADALEKIVGYVGRIAERLDAIDEHGLDGRPRATGHVQEGRRG